MSLIEVSVSLAVVSVLLLAALSAFGSSIRASGSARGSNAAAVFLEGTFENLQAQGFDALLALNGSRFLDDADEDDSSYAVDFVAYTVGVDLLQFEATLVDLRTGRTIGSLTTLRTRR